MALWYFSFLEAAHANANTPLSMVITEPAFIAF